MMLNTYILTTMHYRLKQLLLLVLFIYTCGLNAQNLVINPSFETTTINSTTCNNGDVSFATGWHNAGGASPDLFITNVCTTPQAIRTGSVMAGIITYAPNGGVISSSCSNSDWRELIQGTLSSPLIAGTAYYIEFYVLFREYFSNPTNNIGVKFTNTLYGASGCPYIFLTPDVNYSGPPIYNYQMPNLWTKLTFCYTPTTSGLQYFTIGNFLSNASTSTINVPGNNPNTAYYFIDDVSIIPITTTFSTTASVAYGCDGASATLSASTSPFGLYNYSWAAPGTGTVIAGINTNQAQVQGNGIYTVTTVNTGTCVTIAPITTTIAVNGLSPVIPGIVLSPASTLTCTSPTVTASLTYNNLSSLTYSWSGPGVIAGANTPTATLNAPGNYTLSVYNVASNCTFTLGASVSQNTVQPQAGITLNAAAISCLSPTIQLTGTVSPSSSTYTWTSGSAGVLNSYSILNPITSTAGSYTLAVQNPSNGCTKQFTIAVPTGITTITTSVNSTTLCAGSTVTLNASGSANSYTWFPSASLSASSGNTVVASPATTEVYTVTAFSGTCIAVAQSTITVPTLTTSASTNSSVICSGNAVQLSATGANTYTWSPASGLSTRTGSVVTATPVTTTTYSVVGESLQGCTHAATVTINVVSSPSIGIAASSGTICMGNQVVLTASGATSYTWFPTSSNNASITQSPSVTTTYSITGETSSGNLQCISANTIEVVVEPTPTVQVYYVDPICEGSNTILQAIGASSYTWSPATGLSNPYKDKTTANPLQTTTYTVYGQNAANCVGQASVNVLVFPVPTVYAGRDTTITIGDVLTLQGSGNVAVGFIPTPANEVTCNFCDQIIVHPQENTCYTLIGTNSQGCSAYDDVCVTVDKDWSVFLPNSFTPDADGLNDILLPMGYGLKDTNLSIYDRWGNLLFESSDSAIGWDGKYKGRVCEQGVYVYRLKATALQGHESFRVGHVTLLLNQKK